MRYKMSYTHSVPMHNLLCTVLLLASLIAVRPCIARQLLLRQEADRGAACPPQAKAMFDAVMADPQSSTPVLEACNTSVVQPGDRCASSCYCEVDRHFIRPVAQNASLPPQVFADNMTLEACDYYLFSALTKQQFVSLPVLMVSNDASCGISPPVCQEAPAIDPIPAASTVDQNYDPSVVAFGSMLTPYEQCGGIGGLCNQTTIGVPCGDDIWRGVFCPNGFACGRINSTTWLCLPTPDDHAGGSNSSSAAVSNAAPASGNASQAAAAPALPGSGVVLSTGAGVDERAIQQQVEAATGGNPAALEGSSTAPQAASNAARRVSSNLWLTVCIMLFVAGTVLMLD